MPPNIRATSPAVAIAAPFRALGSRVLPKGTSRGSKLDTGMFSSTKPNKHASPGHSLVCTHRKLACTWRLSKLRCSLGRGLQAATLASLRPRRVQIVSSTLPGAHRARDQHLPRPATVIARCAIAVASFSVSETACSGTTSLA